MLAYRVKACAVDGRAPFFALCSIGNSADMRGYPAGWERDRGMLVGQVEYRREIWWRFGVTAFVGAGQVASTFTDFKGSNTLPGGGAGVRFLLAKKNHINLRLDYSVGQGSHAWYMGMGEAFSTPLTVCIATVPKRTGEVGPIVGKAFRPSLDCRLAAKEDAKKQTTADPKPPAYYTWSSRRRRSTDVLLTFCKLQ